MNNPYQPPAPAAQPGAIAPVDRSKFVLAGIGSLLAAGYWAVITLLFTLNAAQGGASILNVIIPCYLIAMYALRGVQIIQGDVAAARRVMMLHIVGGAFALIYAFGGVGLWAVLQGAKVVINAFGAFTAWRASR